MLFRRIFAAITAEREDENGSKIERSTGISGQRPCNFRQGRGNLVGGAGGTAGYIPSQVLIPKADLGGFFSSRRIVPVHASVGMCDGIGFEGL